MKRSDPRDSILNRLLSGLSSTEIGILVVFLLLLAVTAVTILGPDDPPGERETAGSPAPPRSSPPPAAGGTRPDERNEERWREQARVAVARNQTLERELETARDELRQTREDLAREQNTPVSAGAGTPEAAELQRRLRQREAELARSRADADEARERVAELDEQVRALEQRTAEQEQELQATRQRARAAQSGARQAQAQPGTLAATEHPSCWYDGAGRPEYVWDVTVHIRGLLLRPGPAPANRHLRSALPLSATQTGRYLSDEQFLAQTQPLYEYSVSQACRFYIRLFNNVRGYDLVGLFDEKERVVQQHFLTHRGE